MKERVYADYGVKDCYKAYIEDHKDDIAKNNPYMITYEEYRDILVEYTKEYVKELFNNNILDVPYGLGKLSIVKKKMRIESRSKRGRLFPDWEYWKKTGKLIYHLNEHRDGYEYSFYWKKAYMLKSKMAYSFIATRKNKRALAKVLKTKPEVDFFEKEFHQYKDYKNKEQVNG